MHMWTDCIDTGPANFARDSVSEPNELDFPPVSSIRLLGKISKKELPVGIIGAKTGTIPTSIDYCYDSMSSVPAINIAATARSIRRNCVKKLGCILPHKGFQNKEFIFYSKPFN